MLVTTDDETRKAYKLMKPPMACILGFLAGRSLARRLLCPGWTGQLQPICVCSLVKAYRKHSYVFGRDILAGQRGGKRHPCYSMRALSHAARSGAPIGGRPARVLWVTDMCKSAHPLPAALSNQAI